MRIAKAVREGRWGKVRVLQYLLTRSLAAKLLAVRRVTSNKGRKTPGVDGILWKDAKDKVQAVLLYKDAVITHNHYGGFTYPREMGRSDP